MLNVRAARSHRATPMTPNQIDAAEAEAGEEAAARKRLATLPGFSVESAATARFARLVGMTNRVWKVATGGGVFCLRLPGSGAAALIDRSIEERNARLAAEAGVAPEVLYFGNDGVMLTRFVAGTPLLPGELARGEGAIDRVAAALRRLHESGVEFAGKFQAFATIESYKSILERHGRKLSKQERDAVQEVRAIEEALVAHPSTLNPCHCDPTGRNLIDTGERVWLVDWEYSGMNDPMWDLAYFSIESRFEEGGDVQLLNAYFGRRLRRAEVARVMALKPVAEVQAALWALIQDVEGNTGGDFNAYAKATFARATERLANPRLHESLRTLRP